MVMKGEEEEEFVVMVVLILLVVTTLMVVVVVVIVGVDLGVKRRSHTSLSNRSILPLPTPLYPPFKMVPCTRAVG